MKLAVDQLVLIGLLASSLHWIVARAEITRWLWSRAGGFLGELLGCPACSGTWLGLGLGIVGARPVSIEGAGARVLEIAFAGVMGAWLTPVFQAVMLWGLERTKIES